MWILWCTKLHILFIIHIIQVEVCLIKTKHRWTIPHYSEPIQQMPVFDICFEQRRQLHLKMGTKPPLCDHNTSCFSKEQHCFCAFYRQSSFVSHLV
jgi:hypothetical protein